MPANRPYVVRAGDYLTRLAKTLRFDADAVWADPANADLRALRRDPEMLSPGDVLQVPARTEEPLALQAHATNRYVVDVPRVTVSVKLRGEAGPHAGVAYVVEGAGALREGTTTGDGGVELEVPIDVERLLVHLPELGRTVPVMVGHLDPVETPAGVRHRLLHLGFLGAGELRAEAVTEATRWFQQKSRLPVTGIADEATRAALVRAHGS